MVSFISQLYGGRITDAQLTILCGIIDLIESGDEILADKGFPEVRILAFFLVTNIPRFVLLSKFLYDLH